MRRITTAAFGLILAITSSLTTARAIENTWDPAVQVSAAVQSSPAKITLSWPQDTNGTPSSYTIYRRSPSSTDWGSGTTISGASTSYTDTNVSVGTAYEYRIAKAGSYTGYGYITAGVEAALVDSRGKVVLVVDNTITANLTSELARLEEDLRGDGWTVVRRDVGRNDSPASVKAVIKAVYDSDRANVKSVFLFGHVPVPYSGQFNPDGHPDHVGAWPADVYYGDMDGSWTDNSVNYTQTLNTDPADAKRMSNIPGDGKFDQTTLPSSLELEVGRVDLAKMPVRVEWGGPATVPGEIELLRKYLDKDHNFRHRISNTVRRAIIGDYFGFRGGEAFSASGYRSFAPLVGANNVRNLNTEFNDQRGPWLTELSQKDYLLAYGCGAGAYYGISGLSATGAYTHELVRANVRGVFNLLFGSWLGDWDVEDNILRSPLVTDYGLAAAWSGRPHWFMHPMGLGGTLGSAAKLTQNNNGQYQTIINSSEYRVHVALMGDPTLRLHPVVPASNLNGSISGSTVALSWSGSNDSNLVGYHVYRASSASGSYTRLTSSPVTATNYTDTAGSSGATYMVRAVKLETAASGSYYNAAQGAFWTVGGSSSGSTTPAPAMDSTAPTISLTSPAANATVSATVTVTANATDNVGVAAVQFKLDGANLGTEVTSSPFSTTLNTTTLANGAHTLSAVARDAAGNMASASNVSVNVSNTTVASGSTGSGSTSTSGSTSSTTPSTSTSTATNGTGVVWMDDALPAGAGLSSGWNWVTGNPAAYSGSKALQTVVASGQQDFGFNWAAPLAFTTGDVFVAYVYLDPANTPREIMMSFASNSWEHRAYWGANEISYGTNNSAGRRYMGTLPAAGQWVRLEVPAAQVGLEGQSITGFSFSVTNGRATVDLLGKGIPASTSSTSTTTTPSTSTPTTTTPSTTTTTTSSGLPTTMWMDDALPAGAGLSTGWNWVSGNPAAFSGSNALQTIVASGQQDFGFNWAAPLAFTTGDVFVAYVYLDPANMPREIMLSFASNNWEHRAYWGANEISYGTNNSAGRRYIGALPAGGQWMRLEVPAAQVGLEGQSITGLSLSVTNGRVTFDAAGKSSASASTSTTAPTTATTTPSTSTTTPSTSTSTSPSTTPTAPTLSTNPTTPYTTTTSSTAVWMDDVLPAGAGLSSGLNWMTSSPTALSGTKSLQTIIAPKQQDFGFNWAAALPLTAGDVLVAYVYLDPANLPREIMLSFASNNWEHRAYWGANEISYGTNNSAGRRYMGALPAAGQWVRLEVPAAQVGLEGQSITALSLSVTNGRASLDLVGKNLPTSTSTINSATSPTTATSSPTTTVTSTLPTTMWMDDALPAGAGISSGWNWVTSSPSAVSGTKSLQTIVAPNQQDFGFNWAAPLAFTTGDVLVAYIYLDPANTPRELMLSFASNSWEHRAYWGANEISYGTNNTAGRRYMGALPAAGQWVRLEIPAAQVGLEGQSITGLSLSVTNGRANLDAVGKK